MLTRRQQQALETKAQLLATSKKLIVRDGYDAVSISQICNECNVAKGTFYVYFKSKKDIVGEIVQDLTAEIMEQYTKEKHGNIKEQMLLFHRIHTQSILNQGIDFTREFLFIILQIAIDHPNDKGEHQLVIEELIQEGILSNELHPVKSAEELAYEYVLHIYSSIIDWCTRKKDETFTVNSVEWMKEFIQKLQ